VPTWPTDSLSSGFVYVAGSEPANPEEGETWYDLEANEAKVYDGASWHLLTVTEHTEIGGVSAGQHRSDANIRSTVDGAVDADTVDGQHASDFGGGLVHTVHKSVGGGTTKTFDAASGNAFHVSYVRVGKNGGGYTGSVTFYHADGSSSGTGSSGTYYTLPEDGKTIESIELYAPSSASSEFFGFEVSQQ